MDEDQQAERAEDDRGEAPPRHEGIGTGRKAYGDREKELGEDPGGHDPGDVHPRDAIAEGPVGGDELAAEDAAFGRRAVHRVGVGQIEAGGGDLQAEADHVFPIHPQAKSQEDAEERGQGQNDHDPGALNAGRGPSGVHA